LFSKLQGRRGRAAVWLSKELEPGQNLAPPAALCQSVSGSSSSSNLEEISQRAGSELQTLAQLPIPAHLHHIVVRQYFFQKVKKKIFSIDKYLFLEKDTIVAL